MALTPIQEFDLRVNNELVKRTAVAIMKTAFAVYSEDSATVNHDNRLIWVKKVAGSEQGSELEARRMLPTLLRHPYMQANGEAITDANLESVIAAYLDFFAQG